MKKALITGITGQDGSYLAELLLDKGYEVHGVVRRVALQDISKRLGRVEHLKEEIKIHPGDIINYSTLVDIFDKVKPDECYHLAAQSFVQESFEDKSTTINTNINGLVNVLDALYTRKPDCRFYFAGSSEMFGEVRETPQTEKTPFNPRSTYGDTKVFGFFHTKRFREAYKLFTSSGILFNHESPRRGTEFVTKKITKGVSKIKNGLDKVLILGNLDAKRDWGYAKDYVEAMWLMLQQPTPDDYVIATGKNYTIRDFLNVAFDHANLKYNVIDLHEYSKEDADKEIKLLQKTPGTYIVQHPKFYRPAEVNELLGDYTKANKKLGWQPKTSFSELVKMMVEHDLKT